MKFAATSYLTTSKHNDLEKRMIAEKRRQAGIAFPAPRKQDYLLIIRLDVNPLNDNKLVSQGLQRLCTLFEQIDRKVVEFEDTSEDGINTYPLTRFNFTATIGFGKTFFSKLDLTKKCPVDLFDMPPYYEIGDKSPYVLPQTDMILQLASNNYVVNKMVLQNDNYFRRDKNLVTKELQYLKPVENDFLHIIDAIKGWAKITDAHTGFHRADGKNLMGFYDGISNPYRLVNDNIWISEDEGGKELEGGTYMVFQKIEHNLNEWNKLNTQEQEKWVGRSKYTGLLLGTLSPAEEKRLTSVLYSADESRQNQAKVRLSKLINEQRDPTKNFFDAFDIRYMNINKNCPVSSHARKVNSRKPNGGRQRYIFRRGCLYMEEAFVDYPKSGILFISFQNNVKIFEEMKRNLGQHVNIQSKTKRSEKIKNYSGQKASINNSFDTLTLGGGYYFIPPIPNKKISEVGQLFFE
jgi:Dyp-type peroxidase family